jgi:hypothetical protein
MGPFTRSSSTPWWPGAGGGGEWEPGLLPWPLRRPALRAASGFTSTSRITCARSTSADADSGPRTPGSSPCERSSLKPRAGQLGRHRRRARRLGCGRGGTRRCLWHGTAACAVARHAAADTRGGLGNSGPAERLIVLIRVRVNLGRMPTIHPRSAGLVERVDRRPRDRQAGAPAGGRGADRRAPR